MSDVLCLARHRVDLQACQVHVFDLRQETMPSSLALSYEDRGRSNTFLKSAEVRTGERCFVGKVTKVSFVKWKTFTSEQDYLSYTQTGKHRRQASRNDREFAENRGEDHHVGRDSVRVEFRLLVSRW